MFFTFRQRLPEQHLYDDYDRHSPHFRQEERGGDTVNYIQSKNICMGKVAR